MKALFLVALCICLASFGPKQMASSIPIEDPYVAFVTHNDGSVFYLSTQLQSVANPSQPLSYTEWFRTHFGHDQYSREIKDIYIPQ